MDTKSEDYLDAQTSNQDLDYLRKIDEACQNRDIELILEVLKTGNKLYINRALINSMWLFTDPQYIHIINPDYLHENILRSDMNDKLRIKVMKHIRDHLNDEKRSEEFFTYIKDIDLNSALDWLPVCSKAFAEKHLQLHVNSVSIRLLMELCEKSLDFLQIYCKNRRQINPYIPEHQEVLMKAMKYAPNNVEKYLDVLEDVHNVDLPILDAETTDIIMTKCPERIFGRLKWFAFTLNAPAFAKHVTQEDVKDFILNNFADEDLMYLFNFDDIGLFINRIPKEERFEFVKDNLMTELANEASIRVDREADFIYQSNDDDFFVDFRFSIYRWYKFAPFDTCFKYMTSNIPNETDTKQKHIMCLVMIMCAGKVLSDVSTLVDYYHKNHRDIPYEHRHHFIITLLVTAESINFDKKTWFLLEDIHGEEDLDALVHYVNDNKKANIRSIVKHKIINHQTIPKLLHIDRIFTFNTFNDELNDLNTTQQENLFKFLLELVENNLEKQKVLENLREYTKWVNNAMSLLDDFKKEFKDFPTLFNKIKEIIDSKLTSTEAVNMNNVKTIWYKLRHVDVIEEIKVPEYVDLMRCRE